MTTVDPESGDVVNLEKTDFQVEVWALLDDDGLVMSRVTQVRDLDGNLLQVTTLRDGVLRNLTFEEKVVFDGQPAHVPWGNPDSPVYQEPHRQLLLIERAEAPPAEVLALLEQEIENTACEGLRLVDAADWDARTRCEQWLDSLVPLAGSTSERWLHVVRERQQNEAAIIHPDSPIPAAFRSDLWLRLDEAGRVVAQVGILRDLDGESFSVDVRRDGISYDLSDGEQRPYTPRRPELDSGFFMNVETMSPANRELALAEGQVGERAATLFSACHSYNGARPRFGELPYPIVGEQRHLWLDEETGQPLRATHVYVDTSGQVRQDWTEEVTVEVVDELPPEAEAVWQQSVETDQDTQGSTTSSVMYFLPPSQEDSTALSIRALVEAD